MLHPVRPTRTRPISVSVAVVLEHIVRPPGLVTPVGYSHVTVGTGRVVAIAGQLPVDADGALVGADALAQARQVFANLDAALVAAGASAANLLRFGFFVTDLADVVAIREAREEYLGDLPRPASSLVQVAGLVIPGARLEVDAIAVLPSD